MRIRPLALTVLTVLAAAAPAAPAAAAAHATGAVAYLRALAKDKPQIVVVFRTDVALPFRVAGWPSTQGRIDGGSASLVDVSPSLHCYQASVYGGRVGQRVRVRLGRRGSVLDQTLRVQPMTPEVSRGGTLGCGADPATSAVIFGMYSEPLVAPGRWWFTANSGPYLRDLVWTGWGSPTVTATGTYVSDCASCGPPQRYPVTVRVDGLVDCPRLGTKTYGRLYFERAGGRLASDPSARRRTLETETELFC
jgi:hypothetical protein